MALIITSADLSPADRNRPKINIQITDTRSGMAGEPGQAYTNGNWNVRRRVSMCDYIYTRVGVAHTHTHTHSLPRHAPDRTGRPLINLLHKLSR